MINPSSVCRSCGEPGLVNILSLGRTPLANALLTEKQLAQPEPRYPLDLAFCARCTLVQILETVPPEELFREYLYFSSFSDTMLNHAQKLAGKLAQSCNLDGTSLVVEIASNDGYLLQYYKQVGIPVLGIEPATNIASVAQKQRGIPTICDFFGETLAAQLRTQGTRADVIHAHNVLAHVPDLNGFVQGIHLLLNERGSAIIEVPYVKDMIDRCEFDTIYHEHLCYFSLTALHRLFERHQLVIRHVERVPIHGGSLQLTIGQAIEAPHISQAVADMLAEEADWGVDTVSFYQGFADRVEAVKHSLSETLQALKRGGNTLAAYGAAAKGSTLLNYAGIGRETLEFVVDRSHYKQGHYMPGIHLPVYGPEKLLEVMPQYVLLLAWNFADEIMAQQELYRQRGGRFILPIPAPEIV